MGREVVSSFEATRGGVGFGSNLARSKLCRRELVAPSRTAPTHGLGDNLLGISEG